MRINARPIKPPFDKVVLHPIANDDGTLDVQDHQGEIIARNLLPEQYELFRDVFCLGFRQGAALEREALIFEFTSN
jgi:hypothetical protein